MAETPESQLINLIQRKINPILEKILGNLTLIEKIAFASTNTDVRNYVYELCPNISAIAERSCFNLDIFPENISNKEITITHRVFPYLKKIKFDLRFTSHDIFQKLQIFAKLEKVSVYVSSYHYDENIKQLNLPKITIRQNYSISEHDSVFNIIKQIKKTKKFSIYEGKISAESLKMITNFNLESLKIHNSTIVGLNVTIISTILENQNLINLRATSEKYFKFPGPTRLVHYAQIITSN